MKLHNLGGLTNIDDYVAAKIAKLKALWASEEGARFKSLYPLMFSERDNILWEKTIQNPKNGAKLIQKTTYGKVFDAIEATYSKINTAFGEGDGRLIGLSMANSEEWIVAFWSILHAGFCPLLINTRLPLSLTKSTLERAKTEENLVGIISAETDYAYTGLPIYNWDDIVQKAPSQPHEAFGEAVYLMSSGTSQNVKISSFGAEQIYAQVSDSALIIDESTAMKTHYHGELKQLAFLPFYHVFGLMAVYFWFAFFSRTFVELKSLDADTLLSTIRRHQVTHIFSVPLFWESVYQGVQLAISKRDKKTQQKLKMGLNISRCLHKFSNRMGDRFAKKVLKPLRDELFGDSPAFLITGGGAISQEILEFFNLIGYHLANGYGMTEVGIVCVELSDSFQKRVSGSAGKAFHSIDFSQSDEGTLLIRGKGISRGAQLSEWFDSKDWCRLKKGRVFFMGRSDDLLIGPDGENINPYLYETEFSRLPGVTHVLLLEDKSCQNGKLVLLVEGTVEESVLKHMAEELRLTALISKYIITKDSLLMPDEFKINRRRLTVLVSQRGIFSQQAENKKEPAIQKEEPSFKRESVYAEILIMFATALSKKPSEINPKGDFFADEGGTSLAFFTLDAQFEMRFGYSAQSLCEPGMLTVCNLTEKVESHE